MAHITISNSKRLVRTLSEITLNEIEIAIYKKDIYFFNQKERAMLKGIREFIRDPENFKTQYYNPIVIKDSLKYVYPESRPAYHKDNSCDRLNAHFSNFEIPLEIRKRGEAAVKEFRLWFAKNKHLLETSPKIFIERMQTDFSIGGEIDPKSIDYSNSGSEEQRNYSVQDLENQVDGILREAGKYYRENPDKQQLIKRFGKLTFLAYTHGNIYTNDSCLNDDELKDFLKIYEEKFKKPVKELLLEYYRLLHNPDMTFDATLLDKLGFKPCGSCFGDCLATI